jgi:oligo-alginate lyase
MVESLAGGISRREALKLLAMAGCMAGGANSATAFTPARQTRRPYLFYNASTLRQLKQAIGRDSSIMASLRKQGDDLLNAAFVPESVALVGGGQQAHYGLPANQIADMSLTLGLLFQLTDDPRYANKLTEALLYYTHYERWAGPGLKDRFPPWHSVLETSRFCFGYAAGYDVLHEYLSPKDRKAIADGMLRLGVLPILNDWILSPTRIHSLDTMGHNWWGVCVAGAGIGALALLGDDERSQPWIDAIDAGFTEWFDFRGNLLQNRMATFERSGPSYESVGYTSYGVGEYLRYRWAWQNTYPGQKAAHMVSLNGVADFFLHTLYPTSTGHLTVNFNDSSLHVDVSETVLLLAACGLGTPQGTRYLKDGNSHPQYALRTLLELRAAGAAAWEPPHSCIYPEMGWVTMRSSWDDDSTLLAMKCGYTWNHAHADAGTYLLFDKGVPLIIDSGTCSYDRPEYSTYYRQSQAHNVLLFDGHSQPHDDIRLGSKFPGHMHSLIDGLGLKYAYADATGPMAQWLRRNYRHWLWSGSVLLIIDDVLSFTPGRVDWLLHYAGQCTARGDAEVLLQNGEAQARVSILHPPMTHREELGLTEHNPNEKIPYLIFSSETTALQQHVFAAICLDTSALPKLEYLENNGYRGVRVTFAEYIEETYFNLNSKSGATGTAVIFNELETDASLVQLRWKTKGNELERCFVSDGSYLRHRGNSMMESLSKQCACWSPANPSQIFSDRTSKNIRIWPLMPGHI